MKELRILGLSGSLRKASYNTALIKALTRLAPAGMVITLFPSMDQLPLFNPDRENQGLAVVSELKTALYQADGLLIASPEYAHGVSSVLKTALDWLVSGAEFPAKPVALLNASPRARHALAALREVIVTMSGIIIEPACVAVPLLGSQLDADGIVQNTELSQTLVQAMERFRDGIVRRQRPNPP